MGLNGGDQSVTIDLPRPLHSGSSVTIDEQPYIRIDIPSPTIEEQDYANLPLGEVHTTLAVAMPKTPWKPRITLLAEVDNLITWGMTEDYDCEPEHSTMAKEPATKADTSPPQKTEMPAWSLDTSSQVSVAEMEASMESNPVCNSPTAVAYSSHSDSPTMDLPELQADVNLAVNHMLSIKRSLDLKRQWVIQDFEMSLHQWEAEEATGNERAKIVHSRKDLNTKVKCAKVVMKAKYDYRVVVQEARVIRCSKLKESEATYSEALSENAAVKSLHCATLCREHARCMDELEEWALDAENKSCQDFLLVHQAILHHAPQSLKENLHSSYHILLGQSSSSLQSILFTRAPQAEGQPPLTSSPRPEPKWSPWPKRQHSSTDAQRDTSIDEASPMASQEELPSSKRGKMADWSSALKPSCVDAFSQDSSPMKKARACYFATHPWDWAHDNTNNLSDIFRELAQGAGLLGEAILEIQWSWDGLEHLKHANYVLWSLPRGLKFIRVVSTKESPKVMGLKGIHDPDALWHFAGYTYCPWCRKDGQNEGTIINHLRTVHYKLGLVCDLCFCCPRVMLDTLCQHGQHTCSN